MPRPARRAAIRSAAASSASGFVMNLLRSGARPKSCEPVSQARGPPIDQGELVQASDKGDVFQASPDELPVIDTHSL
jgi:hypothetical protein